MKDKIEILYISNLCSSNVFNKIFEISTVKPRIAAQKYNALLVEGIAKNSESISINTLSAIPTNFQFSKRRFIYFRKEYVDNIIYNYIPNLNFLFLKEIVSLGYVIIKSAKWIIKNWNRKKVVVCDTLNFSISFGALFVSKMFGVKVVGIVTDIPSLMLLTEKPTIRQSIYNYLSSKFINKYDSYVLLTEQMNLIINNSAKPYIVIEGLVDSKVFKRENKLDAKWPNKTILYAGGIYEEYGLKKLVEAFQSIKNESYRLIFYGDGDMVLQLNEICSSDSRIVYRGVVTHNEIVEAQLSASVLINPRLSTLDLSAYSFPSKNLEYMASGTPVLTTRLKGIPDEYFKYVFCIEDESVEGIKIALLNVLEQSPKQLNEFGKLAQHFVFNHKNNILQGKRFISFINNNLL